MFVSKKKWNLAPPSDKFFMPQIRIIELASGTGRLQEKERKVNCVL